MFSKLSRFRVFGLSVFNIHELFLYFHIEFSVELLHFISLVSILVFIPARFQPNWYILLDEAVVLLRSRYWTVFDSIHVPLVEFIGSVIVAIDGVLLIIAWICWFGEYAFHLLSYCHMIVVSFKSSRSLSIATRFQPNDRVKVFDVSFLSEDSVWVTIVISEI